MLSWPEKSCPPEDEGEAEEEEAVEGLEMRSAREVRARHEPREEAVMLTRVIKHDMEEISAAWRVWRKATSSDDVVDEEEEEVAEVVELEESLSNKLPKEGTANKSGMSW